MKKLFASCLLITMVFLLSSHEFWLHPSRFIYKTGDLINIKFLVGENYEGENWKGNRESVQGLELYLDGSQDDLSEHLSPSAGDSLRFAIYDAGTYMVTYHSTNKYIELDAAKFLDYLKEDGLQNAIDYRSAQQETDSMGRELYQRSVKTIFQVGDQYSGVYKKQTGLPLDIIPLQNPYDTQKFLADSMISFKILFRQKPLAHQLIKVWQRVNTHTSKTAYTTDENGIIRFPLKNQGRWMVSTVTMERITSDPKAQWQSYWGSCTWGYQDAD